MDSGSSIFKDGERVIIFTDNPDTNIAGAAAIQLDHNMPACNQVVQYLYNSGIQSLLIEGGASVLGHFISNGLWDEARIFSGEQHFEGGVPAPVIMGKLFSETEFSSSKLQVYMNDRLII
jgi:diaminohydroxyphosphoribosylaminopyrimidine deaminase/5-amino-6-(5-phosphoribosylamino)uracil reductase